MLTDLHACGLSEMHKPALRTDLQTPSDITELAMPRMFRLPKISLALSVSARADVDFEKLDHKRKNAYRTNDR